MAAVQRTEFNFAETRQQFEQQQNKPSSGLRSFMHRRNNSDGDKLASSFQVSPTRGGGQAQQQQQQQQQQPQEEGSPKKRRPVTMAFPKISLDVAQPPVQAFQTGNAGHPHPPSPTKTFQGNCYAYHDSTPAAPRSPSKTNLATLSTRFSTSSSSSSTKENKPLPLLQEPPPINQPPTKPRSANNLKGLFLSRPRSNKNLSIATDQDGSQGKNKENRKPSDSTDSPSTPIYAQFSRGGLGGTASVPSSPYETPLDPFTQASLLNLNHSFRPPGAQPPNSNNNSSKKQRPKSFQPQYTSKLDPPARMDNRKENRGRLTSDEVAEESRSSTWAKARSGSRAKVLSAISTMGGQKSKSPSPQPEASESQIDPQEIDKHLEAMLDRRNIPENQRYKMRNLNSTIKMEFIRQDWAESEGRKLGRPSTNESNDSSMNNSKNSRSDASERDKKHSRGRSFTFSRNSWKIGGSPTKSKKKEGTMKGHTRNKSADSVTNDRPTSSPGGSYSSNAFIAKVTGQQPSDFVNYLRKVQKPEAVEVGKLHKLRLLLRNERVAWTEDFIKQGGMKEIVGLLHRIMAVEWREEHEDALLHEDLLCLKALCTTALALQYLHEIHSTLFPALVHMIFDPEKKGPSEFTTRNIITSVLLTYIQSGTPEERASRARTVLSYLRDPEAKEDERPVKFVLEMRRERPYRVWNKEVVSVTKEVFWIFLHHLNVVALPAGRDRSSEDIRKTANTEPSVSRFNDRRTSNEALNEPYGYMNQHFPQERPPVPAAPYVGGVEWDATNYLASHLDLLNAIIACTPTKSERNNLREEFKISGWERCLGGSLRLCKEKFYPGVHDALRTWVAAAADDGWDVRDVRFGPPQESRSSSPKKSAAGGGAAGKKTAVEEPPPRLEMPKLDFVLDGPLSAAP